MNESNLNTLRLVRMVCPSPEELSVIKNNVKCSYCGLVFKNEPRLRLHDLKVHQRKNLNKTIKECIRYHCPEASCVYSPDSERYFSSMKNLKQHYLKVHAAKRYPCTQCDKSFSTEAARIAHMRVCGVKFTCDCFKIFNTYEALLTHAKRNSHAFDVRYKHLVRRPTKKPSPPLHTILPSKKPIPILPHHPQTLTTTSNVETQTDELPKKSKKLITPSKSTKRRESRQTQTLTKVSSTETRVQKTVETQTTPSIREIARKTLKKSRIRRNLSFKNDFTNVNLFRNSPVNLQHDVEIQDFWEERNTLGTQTSPDKHLLDVFNNSMTQTTFYDSGAIDNLSPTRNFYNSTGGLSRSDPMLMEETDRFSSIETQTEKPYPQSIFDSETQTTEQFDNIEQLLYSNMCTQTCNDILPSELGLSDIQTQTAWAEMEEGGKVARGGKGGMEITGCRWLNIQTSHTETQTDLLSIFHELQ